MKFHIGRVGALGAAVLLAVGGVALSTGSVSAASPVSLSESNILVGQHAVVSGPAGSCKRLNVNGQGPLVDVVNTQGRVVTTAAAKLPANDNDVTETNGPFSISLPALPAGKYTLHAYCMQYTFDTADWIQTWNKSFALVVTQLGGTVDTTNHITVTRGQVMQLAGHGFLPGEKVHMVMHSTGYSLGTVTANANGDVAASAAVPSGIAAGAHTITLTGQTSGRVVTLNVAVAAAKTSSTSGIPAVSAGYGLPLS